MSKELAQDRGGKWALLNATEIVSPDTYEVTVSLEPWVDSDFWRVWQVLMYATWIAVSTQIAIFYVLSSQGVNVPTQVVHATGLTAKVKWIFETIDLIKDWLYLFLFKHTFGAMITLIISLTVPFAIVDAFV